MELTLKQKLQALSDKYYSGLKWEPKAGDYYTTSRCDLELYKVVEVTDDKVKTIYTNHDSAISEWDKETFLTKDFGVNRVLVSPYIFSLSEPLPSSEPLKPVEGEEPGQIFENNSDCYADTWKHERGIMIEGDVVPAMTKEKFIEILSNSKPQPVYTEEVEQIIIDFDTWRKDNEYQIDNTEQYNHTTKELFQIFASLQPKQKEETK